MKPNRLFVALLLSSSSLLLASEFNEITTIEDFKLVETPMKAFFSPIILSILQYDNTLSFNQKQIKTKIDQEKQEIDKKKSDLSDLNQTYEDLLIQHKKLLGDSSYQKFKKWKTSSESNFRKILAALGDPTDTLPSFDSIPQYLQKIDQKMVDLGLIDVEGQIQKNQQAISINQQNYDTLFLNIQNLSSTSAEGIASEQTQLDEFQDNIQKFSQQLVDLTAKQFQSKQYQKLKEDLLEIQVFGSLIVKDTHEIQTELIQVEDQIQENRQKSLSIAQTLESAEKALGDLIQNSHALSKMKKDFETVSLNLINRGILPFADFVSQNLDPDNPFTQNLKPKIFQFRGPKQFKF